MAEPVELMEAFDARARRRGERRDFFRAMLGTAALGVGLAAAATPAAAQTAPTDADILNFALNLEYLEAQFYAFAATGEGLPENILGGTQTRGNVSGARRANLTDRAVIQYAREIAEDERAHVIALRAALNPTNGSNNAVAQPAIDLSPAVFTAAARAAGIDLSGSNGTFDPYADDNSFLLGAYVFEDVGVTAYKGGAPLIASADIVDAAAGILAAEAFHAGIIRAALYRRGVATPALRTNAGLISDARDRLDGAAAAAGPPVRVADDDQGIAPTQVTITSNPNGATVGDAANIVPTDSNGIVFSRNTEQVHNIVYLTSNAVTAGGFFPNGTNNANAALRRSGAN